MRTLLLLVAIMLALTGHASAQMFVDYATVSPTTTLLGNRLCYSDSRDIACDGAAGLLLTSGTLQLTAVSATNISGTTATLTSVGAGNITASGYVRAANISASSAIQIGSNALACASGTSGTMRYSAVSSTMEYCNGTAWTSMGPSATQPVAFSARKSTTQSIPRNSFTKLTFPTELFDTNSNFASDAFTVTVPGKYLLTAQTGVSFGTNALGDVLIALYKNGSALHWGSRATDNSSGGGGTYTDLYPNITAVVDAQVGDVFEIYIYQNNNTNSSQNAIDSSRFDGVLLSPQVSGGGGGATPAGSSADVQFNSSGALAADTGVFTYANGTLRSTSVSTTNVSATSLQLNGASVTCAAGTIGMVRRSPTTGRLQVCQ